MISSFQLQRTLFNCELLSFISLQQRYDVSKPSAPTAEAKNSLKRACHQQLLRLKLCWQEFSSSSIAAINAATNQILRDYHTYRLSINSSRRLWHQLQTTYGKIPFDQAYQLTVQSWQQSLHQAYEQAYTEALQLYAIKEPNNAHTLQKIMGEKTILRIFKQLISESTQDHDRLLVDVLCHNRQYTQKNQQQYGRLQMLFSFMLPAFAHHIQSYFGFQLNGIRTFICNNRNKRGSTSTRQKLNETAFSPAETDSLIAAMNEQRTELNRSLAECQRRREHQASLIAEALDNIEFHDTMSSTVLACEQKQSENIQQLEQFRQFISVEVGRLRTGYRLFECVTGRYTKAARIEQALNEGMQADVDSVYEALQYNHGELAQSLAQKRTRQAKPATSWTHMLTTLASLDLAKLTTTHL